MARRLQLVCSTRLHLSSNSTFVGHYGKACLFSLVPLMSKLLIIEVCEVVFSEKLVVANVWRPRAFASTN